MEIKQTDMMYQNVLLLLLKCTILFCHSSYQRYLTLMFRIVNNSYQKYLAILKKMRFYKSIFHKGFD